MTAAPHIDDSAWEVPVATLDEFAPKRTRYCLCVPVLNEGDRIRRELAGFSGVSELPDVLIADGGSTDGATDPTYLRSQGVRALVRLERREGLSAQLRAVYAYALRQGYEGVITIDGNDKDDPAAVPDFVRALERGLDCVQGSRYVSGGHAVNTPWSRALAIRLIHAPLISVAAGFRYTDTTNGFRGYSRDYLLDARVQPFRDVFRHYELLWFLNVRAPQLGRSTAEVPVTRRYPGTGAVPTKITSVRGHCGVLTSLLRAVTGGYDPDV